MQTIIDTNHLPERVAAALLNVTRHELRRLREQALKIMRCTVSDGSGI
jgi:hypothetical protein